MTARRLSESEVAARSLPPRPNGWVVTEVPPQTRTRKGHVVATVGNIDGRPAVRHRGMPRWKQVVLREHHWSWLILTRKRRCCICAALIPTGTRVSVPRSYRNLVAHEQCADQVARSIQARK